MVVFPEGPRQSSFQYEDWDIAGGRAMDGAIPMFQGRISVAPVLEGKHAPIKPTTLTPHIHHDNAVTL